MGLEPVHDHLNGLFGLVLEQLEQRPGVTLHASASDEDRDGLERIGEYVPLAAAIRRCGTLRAKDDTSWLRERLVERVERVTPEKQGGGVERETLQQVLDVYGSVGGGTARDEIESFHGSLLKDAKVRDAFLCEERAGDLAALSEDGEGVSFGQRAGRSRARTVLQRFPSLENGEHKGNQ